MKLGAEDRPKLIALSAVGGIAIALLLWTVFSGGDSGPSPTAAGGPSAALAGASATANAAAAPAAVAPAPAAAVGKNKRPRLIPNALDPRLHLDLLAGTENVGYSGSGRNIFVAEADIPKVVQTPRIPKKEQDRLNEIVRNTPPPTPPAPPINLKFYGFANKPGEPKKIFLSQGDDIFVAVEGDVVNRRYRVVRINANSVDIEDTLTKNHQSIPLTLG